MTTASLTVSNTRQGLYKKGFSASERKSNIISHHFLAGNMQCNMSRFYHNNMPVLTCLICHTERWTGIKHDIVITLEFMRQGLDIKIFADIVPNGSG